MNTNFSRFKKQALEAAPLRISGSISEIQLATLNDVKYKGKIFKLGETALKDLSKLLGLSTHSKANVNKSLDKNYTISLYNSLIKQHGKRWNARVQFILTRKGVLERIVPTKSAVISNSTFLDIAERIISTNNMDVHDMSVNKEGELIIQSKGHNSEFQIKGFKDEVFESGLSISNTLEGIKVDPFVFRLICTNGMVTKLFDESVSLSSTNKTEISRFFDQLHNLEVQDFRSKKFPKKVQEAINTKASVYELTQAMKLLAKNSYIDEYRTNDFIPFEETFHDYRKVGVDLNKINNAKKKNAKSSISVWDVINGITDFASHDYGYEVKDPVNLQVYAGDLLCKEYDMSNILDVSPY